MPKKITLCLSFFIFFSLISPQPLFSQTLTPEYLPVPTFDPSNVTVGLGQADSKYRENQTTVFIPVELNHGSAIAVVVDVIVSAGDANVGQDYRLLTPRVTIPVGAVDAKIEVEVFDDLDKESVEMAVFELTSAEGAELDHYKKTHHLKLIDNDGSWLESIAGIVSQLLP